MEMFMEFLDTFKTENVEALLRDLNLAELMHNPVFLGVMAAIALICLFKRWHNFLAMVLGITGFTWLVSYTLEHKSGPSQSDPTVLVFIGGGVVVIGIMIYLFFIKTD